VTELKAKTAKEMGIQRPRTADITGRKAGDAGPFSSHQGTAADSSSGLQQIPVGTDPA
jgi:hypothetical protein